MILQTMQCRFCEAVGRLLDNPYQYSGQVLAKLCVNVATIIWALVVLVKPGALRVWPGALFSGDQSGEDVLAIVLLLLCAAALWRLLKRSRPLTAGACVYGVLLLLWLYTFATLLVAVHTGLTAPRPGQLAGVTVVTALAMFAFISNPKRRRDGSPIA